MSEAKKIGWCSDAKFAEHVPLSAKHPERPERLEAIHRRLDSEGWTERLEQIEARDATIEQLAQVHDREHIEWIREVSRGGGAMLDVDTYCSRGTYDAAVRAAGAAIAAVDAVAAGKVDRAFAAVRPPGHHATADRAMGFCLLNNIAIAARYALRELGMDRVLIVDFDAHHGNGTQSLFYEDDSVLYFSVHQHPFFPGSGAERETGRRRGEQLTLNVPLTAGDGDETLLEAFRDKLPQAAREFRPQIILVSAGFDGHASDRLSALSVSTEAYGEVGGILAALADELCAGRLVSVLEGGYDLESLGASVVAYLEGQQQPR